MRSVARHHLRQIAQRGERRLVHWHLAERRHKSAVGRNGEAAHGDAVHRAEQHDAAHDAACGRELVVGARGDRAGIDVAGVRHDERLRESEPRRRLDAAEELVHFGDQAARVARVEHARDGGAAYGCHTLM